MSRRASGKTTPPASHPHPPRPRPGAFTLFLLLLAAIVCSTLSLAAMLRLDGYAAALWRRNQLLFADRDDPRRDEWWQSRYADLRRTPPPDVPAESFNACLQLLNAAAEYAAGKTPIDAAVWAIDLAARDRGNNLSRATAAWLEIENQRAQGADAAARWATFETRMRAPPAAQRTSTYEAEEHARWYLVFAQHTNRADLARLLIPSLLDDSPHAVLPAMVKSLNELADELAAAGRAADASACRHSIVALPGGLLREEVSPGLALLCADLIARTGDRAIAAQRGTAGEAEFDWRDAADSARRFRADLHARIEHAGADVFDSSRPLPAGTAHAVAVATLLAAALLVFGGALAFVTGSIGAAWLRGPATVQHAPRTSDADDARALWRSVRWVACLPPLLAGTAMYWQFTHGGLSWKQWPALLAVAGILSMMLLSTRHGLRYWLGVALSAYALFPPTWSSMTARRLGGEFWLIMLAMGVVAIVLTIDGIRAMKRRGPLARPAGAPQRTPPAAGSQSRRAFASACGSWLTAGAMALLLSLAHLAADRRFVEAMADGPQRVETWIGDDWRNKYFARVVSIGG